MAPEDQHEGLRDSLCALVKAKPRGRTNPLRMLFHLDELLLPWTDRQYAISSGKTREAVLASIESISKKPGSKLESKLKDSSFTIRPSRSILTDPIATHVEGEVVETATGSEIRIRTMSSAWAEGAVNAPLAAGAGLLISYAVSSYLLPHPILLFYSLVGTICLPVVLTILAVVLSRWHAGKHLRELLNCLVEISGKADIREADGERWQELKTRPAITSRVAAASACGLIYLGAAFGLHKTAWDYWCKGEYAKCADLCHPVASLAQAVLGAESASVGDCKYYLAECYRCLGRLADAARLYKESIGIMGPTLGDDNPFLADAIYNLGRTQEEQGNYAEARENYEKALSIWAGSPIVGKGNIVYAKGLNRLAMLTLKQGEPERALSLLERAYSIDKRYGKYARLDEDMNDLGAASLVAGKSEGTTQILLESLNRKKERLGEGHLSLGSTLINLSAASLASGKVTEARMYYDQAVNILHGNRDDSMPASVTQQALRSLSKEYGDRLKKERAAYEVPNFDTRADTTYAGDGRL